MNSFNYQRLSFLGDKLKAGNASIAEKNEFMHMLFQMEVFRKNNTKCI